MRFRSSLLLPFWLHASLAAQSGASGGPTDVESIEYTLGEVTVRRHDDLANTGAASRAEWSRDGGLRWQALRGPDDRLHFRMATFDPLRAVPAFAAPLAVPPASRLRIVQFRTQLLPGYREALRQAGAEVLHFVPANALLVRCDDDVAEVLAALPCVRWLGGLPNALKLDAELRTFAIGGGALVADCNLVLAAKTDRVPLLARLAELGARVLSPCDGSTMVQAALTPGQLLALLAGDLVVWADVAGPDGVDVDNARAQGGADYLAAIAGITGDGVRIEVTEWLDEQHPDLAGRVLVRGVNGADQHGHATAGIVGGSGAGLPEARGLAPDAWLVEGAYTSANHFAQILGSVDPLQPWRTMVATASWGAPVTDAYNSISQAVDDALFTSDLTRCNSMGNNGNQLVRPESWAKNSIAVGGVKHGNDALPGNDRWNQPGDLFAASIGPAADGRIRPDVVAYFDGVLTTDLPGAAGFGPGNYVTFGGTSAATPIVAGYVALLQQMFTDGTFGNPLPLPATPANRFENRPHMSTSKALLCNTARQYPFAGAQHDLTRTHQGWGFPDARRAWDHRDSLVALDEYDTLETGQAREYWVQIEPGTPEFRATLVWAEPAALPAVAFHLVNDLDLRVTRVADGVSWWGNHGLDVGVESIPGGAPNARDNLECVNLVDPQPGTYVVRVEAAAINVDGRLETPALDADFALVMHPTAGYRNTSGPRLDLVSNGPGHLAMVCTGVPATGWTEGHTAVAIGTDRGAGFGSFFGLEYDILTIGMWTLPAAVDNPLHFVPGGPGAYPFVPYTFDPALVAWLATFEIHIDAVLLLWNGTDIVAVSNVDRIELQ